MTNPRETARKLLGRPPNPGSNEAKDRGCSCPVLDNFHGMGAFGDDESPLFWINEDCPLHGRKDDT